MRLKLAVMSDEWSKHSSLEALSAEGQYQSSGVFTLDQAEALRKIKKYQLPRPAAWILKVIQAAVSSGASLVEIVHTGKELSVRFDSLAVTWETKAVIQALTDFSHHPPPWRHHFRLGFWPLTSVAGVRAELYLPGQKARLLWEDGSLEMHPVQGQEDWNLVIQVPSTSPEALCPAALRLELAEYAFAAPVTIKFQNELVTDLLGSHARPPGAAVCSIGAIQAPNLPTQTFLARQTAAHPWPAQGKSGSAAYLLGTAPRPVATTVYWISCGVVVGRDRLNLPVSDWFCHFFIPDDGLPQDLSGLQLVEHAQREIRREAVLAKVCPAIPVPSLKTAYKQVTRRWVLSSPRNSHAGCLTAWLVFFLMFVLPLFSLGYAVKTSHFSFWPILGWAALLTSPLTALVWACDYLGESTHSVPVAASQRELDYFHSLKLGPWK